MILISQIESKSALEKVIADVNSNATINRTRKIRAITKRLCENGIFELKETAALVSKCFETTRHAIYIYNREFKTQK
ncbi:helix-turn-helix domain-containing protein [Vibrio sp. MACH09]|uniref:helix-turn-helix domain-containing protein n=1 Tax=Vibrio sp. MACH09 TaxID=3025122 RepID=UPI00398BE8E4